MGPWIKSIIVPDLEIALLGSGPMPTDPAFPTTEAKYENVVVQGNYAYVAGGAGDSVGEIGLTLVIYDVSNVANPVAISYITNGSVPWTGGPSYLNGSYQMAINGNYLYVFSSGASYLYIVNVTNPANPFNVSGLLITGTPGSLYGGVYSNGFVYIATQNKGLTIVNVSNPLAPVQVFQEGGTLNKSIGVAINGSTVFTTNYQTAAPWTVRYLKSWNVSNPSAPVLLETYTLPSGTKPGGVSLNGHYAYVADLNTATFQIIDVSNLTAMNYIASMQASASFNVQNNVAFSSLSSNYAYLFSGGNATFGGAIDLYDITNPSVPVLIKTYKQNQATSPFGPGFIYNNVIYVGNYGLAAGTTSTLNIYSTQNFSSDQIDVQFCVELSAQTVSNNASEAGRFEIQGSNNLSTPFSFVTLSALNVTGSGTQLIPKFDLCYAYLKAIYTNTGSGGIAITLKGE
jgi:hypothetical protein